jgi:hypothetical protein
MPVIIYPPGTPLPDNHPFKGGYVGFGIKPPPGYEKRLQESKAKAQPSDVNDPLAEEIISLKTREERVHLIWADINSKTFKYESIPAWELAQKYLGIPIVDGSENWQSCKVARRVSLNEEELDQDAKMTPEEKDLLEEEITNQIMEEGGGWEILTLCIQGPGKSYVDFEVCVGDGGEPFNVLGPYEINRGETNFTDDLVVGESW